MPPTLAEHVNSYVPPVVRRHLVAAPTPLAAPAIDHFAAVVLFADISGFTPLAETLARRGPAGAEALTRLLNDYLGQQIELIAAHGGEVVSFAGDAVLAMWSAPASGENLPRLTQRAAHCALAIQAQLNNYQPIEEAQLLLRLGISAGDVKAIYVGGVGDRWQFLLAGEPLTQMGIAEGLAEPGDVVLDFLAWQYLSQESGNAVSSQALPLGYRRLEAPPSPPLSLSTATGSIVDDASADTTAVRSYVPQSVLFRLDADQPDWLAELRCVTVLFISIKGFNFNLPAILDQVQAAVCATQSTLSRFEGIISQLIVDNNGTVLIAAFGLPPHTHEDDAVRAVQAALLVQAQLEQQGLLTSIGITTGRVFCGPIGNDRRRQYTMVGSVINLAARLMQISSNQILCDAATAQAAQSRVQFESLAPVALKGKSGLISIFRPCELTSPENSETVQDSSPTEQAMMLGRREERERLARRLDDLTSGVGGVVLIEGEPGIGKSRMVADLLGQLKAKGCTALIGAGDAIELATPYHAWRAIFTKILGVGAITELQARRTQVLNHFQSTPELSTPELLRLVPLLNAVLPLDFPDSELTAQMTGQMRADNTRDLLRHLLEAFAAKSPTVLILEDAHWLDSASWSLALMAQQQVQPLLLVAVTRPLTEPVPTEYRQLLQVTGAEQLKLEALPADNILELVCQRLGITMLAPAVADLIQQKGQGNPFFTEELAYSLRESGLITINGGNCRIAPDVDLQTVTWPDSVQGVITGRIDRLTPSQQLTLKAASVIGRVFPYKILHDIYPGTTEASRLPEYLEGLERLDITPLDTPEPNLAHIFKHVITQEVSYNLMLFAQRRELHQAVAQWYERASAEDLAPYYSLLAYHWGRAEVRDKTIEYCEKAGEQALRHAAYQEAAGFFKQALALEAQEAQGAATSSLATSAASLRSDNLKRARWERQLAEALMGMGQLLESRQHLERAAALAQCAVPTTRGRLALGLTHQVLQEVGNRLWPSRHERKTAEEKAGLLEAARSYERLAHNYFLNNQMALTLYCSLRTLNLSEAVGPSPELARACANSSISAGLVPLRRLSDFYDRRAAQVAQSTGQLRALNWVTALSGLCSMNVAELPQARKSLESAIEMAEGSGDRRQWIEGMAMLSLTNHYAGRFAEAARQAAEIHAGAIRSGDIQAQVWGFTFHVINLLALDQVEEAADLMDAAETLLKENVGASLGRQEQMEVYGILPLVRLRQGQAQAARQAADEMLRLIGQAPPTAAAILFGYSNVAEVYLSLCATEQCATVRETAALDKALLQQAARACIALRKFARVFPLGRPRAWLMKGVLHRLVGKPRSAALCWRKSLAIAERLDMPYDQGRAHYEIGRHLNTGHPARPVHLEQACAIFDELGAVYDLKQAQAILVE